MKIVEINPSQLIANAWRDVNGKRQLVAINYQETDWPNGFEHHYNHLKSTILSGGIAIGAFDTNGRLCGFATVERKFFGNAYQYVLLDQLFISLEHRKKGIGKKLFLLCAQTACDWGAEKMYICAGSAEETIAFYIAIGCKEAVEINQELYDSDPRDFQLEYAVS